MQFTTDKQTLEDLNIFGQHGKQSIYDLFSKTFTRGGAEVMEDMFRFPLTDAAEINKRSGMIQSFLTIPLFDFNAELFDLSEQYLNNTDERTKIVPSANNLRDRIGNFVAEDTNYKFVSQGYSALTQLLKNLYDFLQVSNFDDGHIYHPEKVAILHLLADLDPDQFIKAAGQKKPTREQLAERDVFYRFSHQETLKKVLRHLYILDVCFSVGKIASARGFIFANAQPAAKQKIHIEGVYHPRLKEAVPNAFLMDGTHHVMFLTGANMAGKSTFMKSIGVAMYLAHIGFPVRQKV